MKWQNFLKDGGSQLHNKSTDDHTIQNCGVTRNPQTVYHETMQRLGTINGISTGMQLRKNDKSNVNAKELVKTICTTFKYIYIYI